MKKVSGFTGSVCNVKAVLFYLPACGVFVSESAH